VAVKTKKPAKESQDQVKWPFGKRNYLVFALALVVIIIGYITLGQGSITLAPILLVLGYCVLIPIALIIRGRSKANSNDKSRQQPGS
jgi:hypothetical protein